MPQLNDASRNQELRRNLVGMARRVDCIAPVESDSPDERQKRFDAIDRVAPAPDGAQRHWVKVSDLAAQTTAEFEPRIRHRSDLVVAKRPKKTQAMLAP